MIFLLMEGYQDPGFTLAGQQGTRSGILGTVGTAVGGFVRWTSAVSVRSEGAIGSSLG